MWTQSVALSLRADSGRACHADKGDDGERKSSGIAEAEAREGNDCAALASAALSAHVFTKLRQDSALLLWVVRSCERADSRLRNTEISTSARNARCTQVKKKNKK